MIVSLAALLVLASTSMLTARPIVTLKAVAALPVELAGLFRQPLAFQAAPDGGYYVFDRRGHTVYRIDAARTSAKPIVTIGAEAGRLLRPSAFSAAADGSFAVADAPLEKERVQVFAPDGLRLAGFELPSRSLPRVTFDSIVLNGVGSLQYTGERVLVSQPDSGSLITEYDIYGRPQRTIGRLRDTGHEHDPALHVALNSGIPLAVPGGGFYFVFQAGEPTFRRYDDKGTLVYMRHIEGREIDRLLAEQPRAWPTRKVADLELPVVTPVVRAAAVDANGHLWVSLTLPMLIEYDADGDKVRTVQLRAAGTLAATSLAFARSHRLLVTPGLFEFDTR